jgi:outer membrane immunogenic protein
MKKLVLALASLALFTGSASAADMAVKAPPMAPPAPVYNWTGFWISGGFGYALADVGTSATAATAPFAFFDPGHDLGMKGWLGKVGAGWDYQFAGPLGNWVVGAFVDGSWSNIRGQDAFLCIGCAGAQSFAGQRQNDWSWAVGGRVGYVVTPTLLTYFNGGWTQSHWKQVNWIDNNPADIGVGFGSFTGLVAPSQTRNGWFIGGGTEYSFANSFIPIRGLFWKNEVRFSEFGNNTVGQLCTVSLGAGCGVAGSINSLARTHIVEQAATTELVYRFNWGGPGVVAKY